MQKVILFLVLSVLFSTLSAVSNSKPDDPADLQKAGDTEKNPKKAAAPQDSSQTAAAQAKEDTAILEFEKDSLGQLRTFDFSMKMKPISDKKLSFSSFKDGHLLVFYFSATCGHCKKAAPYLLKLAEELKEDGLEMVVIATGSNKEKDINTFISSLKVDRPVFQDEKREFSKNYGTRHVPVILMVHKNGNYIRIKDFKNEVSPDVMKAAYLNTDLFQQE
jgi:thiol-disulfide isomerase/thioredoxin